MSTKTKSLRRDKKAQALPGGNILVAAVTIITLLIIAYVGIMIVDTTHEATELTQWNESAQTGDKLYNASADLINVTGTVFSMYGVLIIVFVAAIIIGLLLTSFLGGKYGE